MTNLVTRDHYIKLEKVLKVFSNTSFLIFSWLRICIILKNSFTFGKQKVQLDSWYARSLEESEFSKKTIKNYNFDYSYFSSLVIAYAVDMLPIEIII